MSIERPEAVTLKGNPFTLVGPLLQVGDTAPDFSTVGKDMKPVTLADTAGGVRIFSVVPSLDTPVCDTQTRRFNEEAARIPGAKIYTVSVDLPFAQARWSTATRVDRIVMLSDHREVSFGKSYGTLIKELRLNCRAVFVVDAEGILRHVEYVGEVGDYPDYDAALTAARSASGS